MNNSNQPINPITIYKADGDEVKTENSTGLTKREYFAIMILQGNEANIGANKWSKEKRAATAIELADELLKQLEEK